MTGGPKQRGVEYCENFVDTGHGVRTNTAQTDKARTDTARRNDTDTRHGAMYIIILIIVL